MKRELIAAAFGLFVSLPLAVNAETHQVTVRSSFFSPNDLVILPGDTVVWTYSAVQDGCEYGCPPVVLHNVKADDFSFSSGPPAEDWTYQQTFVQPGLVLYHCEAHSVPGRDINSFMNGRITVQNDVDSVFRINPGLNDAWFNQATNGQGFLITVFPDIGQMFLAWFTYDTERPPEDVTALVGEPGHRWLTAQGPYAGDTASLTLFVTEGGVFDASEPPASTDLSGDGTMTLEFSDCANAIVTYEITSLDVAGEIPIQRITLDNVPLCQSLAEQIE